MMTKKDIEEPLYSESMTQLHLDDDPAQSIVEVKNDQKLQSIKEKNEDITEMLLTELYKD